MVTQPWWMIGSQQPQPGGIGRPGMRMQPPQTGGALPAPPGFQSPWQPPPGSPPPFVPPGIDYGPPDGVMGGIPSWQNPENPPPLFDPGQIGNISVDPNLAPPAATSGALWQKDGEYQNLFNLGMRR